MPFENFEDRLKVKVTLEGQMINGQKSACQGHNIYIYAWI